MASERNPLNWPLDKSEANFRLAFENAVIGRAMANTDGKFIRINKAFCQMLEYSEAQLLKKTWMDITHPDDLELSYSKSEPLRRGQVPSFNLVHRLLSKRKKVVWVDLNVVLIRDPENNPLYLLGDVVDVTNWKRAEKDLKKNQELLNISQQLTRTGGWEWDVAAQKGFWTDEVYRIHGLEINRDKTYFETSIGCYHPKDRDRVTQAFDQALKTGKPYDLEARFTNVKGKELWVRTIGRPVVKNGKTIKLVGNILDITEQKNAQLEKDKLEQQLRHVLKMEAVGTMAGGIAHEFNNVLSSIMGYTELSMEELTDDSSIKGYLSQVIKSAERAKKIVEQIMEFSREGYDVIKPVGLGRVINIATKDLYSSLPENIEIQTNIEDGLPPVMVNLFQVSQVLANLCSNAVTAMKERGGFLRITLKRVYLQDKTEGIGKTLPGSYQRLCVIDNGKGIPADRISRIFDPFYTTSEVGQGSGMGLAVVYGIIKNYQGYISVTSEPEKGSVFNVFIPETMIAETG